MEVRDILKPAVVVQESASFKEAMQQMVKAQTNSLLVVDEEGYLVGEVHIADLLDAIVPEHLDGDSVAEYFSSDAAFIEAVQGVTETPVELFMSMDINPVTLEDSLMAVAAVAIAQRKAHIPVTDHDGRPVGIISRRGIKHIIAHALGIKD